MITSLDLLVLVFMALMALGAMSLVLMFLIRNNIARRVFMYVSVALGVYLAIVGFTISMGAFPFMDLVSVVIITGCIAAVVFERISKFNKHFFTVARILAAAGVVLGLLNVFVI